MFTSILRLAAVAGLGGACCTAACARGADALPLPVAETVETSPAALPDPAITHREAILPAGTPIYVTVDSDLSTQDQAAGDTFTITVSQDVIAEGAIVIPKGTTGSGQVTFSTDRGGFGKGGIIGIAVRDLDLDGRKIAIDGRYREEGANSNGGAAATMFMVGILAAAVKGKHSVIPKGRELKARTGEPLTYVSDSPASPANAPANDEAADTEFTPGVNP